MLCKVHLQERKLTLNSLWYINAGINILTDLMIATLPLPIIFKLKAANKHKIALSVMFGIGWM